ncbi:hypothetical protein [Novosphingobium sp. SG720]|uniref:hypothetical protein n=1 Tax=Novosphingobium sp. SG720 TaxID=2586998 RepID=UPI001445CF63|nr:hypothetical protein [Novosphingobium sp. SG720]NKJ43217.1 hypothetical protein [Novosphingobium sp. SG720]
MAFDLRNALLRKEEYESARIAAYDFATTVHALKAVAAQWGQHPVPLLDRMVEQGLAAALTMLAGRSGQPGTAVDAQFLRALADARTRWIARHGDPAPVRLV